MIERTEQELTSLWPRTTGAFWLGCILASIASFVIWSKLVRLGDAAVTAANILQNETLFRLGFVADLASGAFYVGVTALLFYLLRPVSRSGSLLAAFFGMYGIAIGGVGLVGRAIALVLLHGDPALSAFTTAQLQAAALITLRVQSQVFPIGMVFFGLQCAIVGYLITRSGYIPKALGILLALGGASYLLSSFATFMDPQLGARLGPFIMPVAVLGEGALTLWLLFKGVDSRQTLQRTASAA